MSIFYIALQYSFHKVTFYSCIYVCDIDNTRILAVNFHILLYLNFRAKNYLFNFLPNLLGKCLSESRKLSSKSTISVINKLFHAVLARSSNTIRNNSEIFFVGITQPFFKMLNRRHSSYFSYGSRQTTEQCWETIVIVCLQSIIGVMISATMAGIVFAKLARPKARSNTVMFSKNAVITQREGQLWLMFRLGNMRKSHLIESHLRAQLIHHRKTTKEGEILSYECEELPITTLTLKNTEPEEDFATEDRTLFIFPTTVAHRYTLFENYSKCRI